MVAAWDLLEAAIFLSSLTAFNEAIFSETMTELGETNTF